MKNFTSLFSCFLIILLLGACQKEKITATDYITEISVHSDDQARFSTEIDALNKEINEALEMNTGFSGKTEIVQATICDATIIFDTLANPRTITITYNGTNCLGNRKRFGKVIVTMASTMRWKNPAAVVTVIYQNMKIIRTKDNKEMIISGNSTYTNITGGLLANLATLPYVIHTAFADNLHITFDNGKEWSWKLAQKRNFTYNNGIVTTITGTHAGGGINGIAMWGNNRYGHPFTTPILIPLVTRQNCNFRVVSGKIEHITDFVSATVTLGLDESGNPTGCPGTNNYFLEVVWMGPSGIRRTARIPY